MSVVADKSSVEDATSSMQMESHETGDVMEMSGAEPSGDDGSEGQDASIERELEELKARLEEETVERQRVGAILNTLCECFEAAKQTTEPSLVDFEESASDAPAPVQRVAGILRTSIMERIQSNKAIAAAKQENERLKSELATWSHTSRGTLARLKADVCSVKDAMAGMRHTMESLSDQEAIITGSIVAVQREKETSLAAAADRSQELEQMLETAVEAVKAWKDSLTSTAAHTCTAAEGILPVKYSVSFSESKEQAPVGPATLPPPLGTALQQCQGAVAECTALLEQLGKASLGWSKHTQAMELELMKREDEASQEYELAMLEDLLRRLEEEEEKKLREIRDEVGGSQWQEGRMDGIQRVAVRAASRASSRAIGHRGQATPYYDDSDSDSLSGVERVPARRANGAVDRKPVVPAKGHGFYDVPSRPTSSEESEG